MGGGTLLLLLIPPGPAGSGGAAATQFVGPYGWSFFFSSSPVVNPIYADLVEALRGRFLASPALAALTEVYNRTAEGDLEYPYLIVNVIQEIPEIVTLSAAYPSWATVQITVLDDDDRRGYALRNAAFLELAPVVKPVLLFADGNDSGGRIPGSLWELRQPGTGRTKGSESGSAWAFSFSYRLYLTRSWT